MGMCCEEDDDWMKKCMEYEVEDPRPRGRPKRTCREVVKKDRQVRKLNTEDATRAVPDQRLLNSFSVLFLLGFVTSTIWLPTEWHHPRVRTPVERDGVVGFKQFCTIFPSHIWCLCGPHFFWKMPHKTDTPNQYRTMNELEDCTIIKYTTWQKVGGVAQW